MGKVTKEQVEKAKADAKAAEAEWDAAVDGGYAPWKTADAAFAAFDKYIELKEEYENGGN